MKLGERSHPLSQLQTPIVMIRWPNPARTCFVEILISINWIPPEICHKQFALLITSIDAQLNRFMRWGRERTIKHIMSIIKTHSWSLGDLHQPFCTVCRSWDDSRFPPEKLLKTQQSFWAIDEEKWEASQLSVGNSQLTRLGLRYIGKTQDHLLKIPSYPELRHGEMFADRCFVSLLK